VALARALVNRPAILLADEPTGNLDEASGAAVMDLLLSLARADGAAVLLVTHSPAHAARADRRLVLRAGRLDPA
jgi:predicted ABC-type transport system involved in lysophospholipase L1 biosynthesis ATPase subunit